MKFLLALLLLEMSSPQRVTNLDKPGILAEEMLAAHNSYRAKIGSPPLSWSVALAERAQEWASLMISRNAYSPRRDGVFGESLFEISGAHASAWNVVNAWASEQSSYHYRTNSCSARCGHYTQVIWRDTQRVGCGVARNNRREVWVCNYDPPGNVLGERPY